MIGTIRECQRIIQELRTRVSRTKNTQIRSEATKKLVREVVDGYFRTDRPILLHHFRDETLFADIDRDMQDLLRFTQRVSLKSKYLSCLKRIQMSWADIEVKTIPQFGDLTGGEVPAITSSESRIIETLEKLSEPAATCYKQALDDLHQENRLSWRGPATELREALREALDTLAPDKEVVSSPGFKLEANTKGPTMKQKVVFILKSRRVGDSARKSVTDATDVVEEKVGGFVRSVYVRSSGSVHVRRDKEELVSLKRFVDIVLEEILEIR